MKSIIFLILSVSISFLLYKNLDFTSKYGNSIIQMSSYEKKVGYKFKKITKKNNEINIEPILVKSTDINSFKDSLIEIGFSNFLIQKSIEKPKFTVDLNQFEFNRLNKKGDSVFVFDLSFNFMEDEFKTISRKFETLTPKKSLRTRLSQIDIFESCSQFKGTSIKRLFVELERISEKPLLYVTDSTVIDYNYSCTIYF